MKRSNYLLVFNWGCVEPKIIGCYFTYDDLVEAAKVHAEENYKDEHQYISIDIQGLGANSLSYSELGVDDH